MNAGRRKEIAAVIADLDNARASIENARDLLDQLQSDERDALAGLPESLQGSDRGQAMEAAADALQEAYDEADSAATALGEAIAAAENAAG